MILGPDGLPIAGSANASVGRGMMRNVGARQAAMFGGNNPYDEEVEYLESNGNQYIDTDIYFNTETDEIYLLFRSLNGNNFAIAGTSSLDEPRNRVAFWNFWRCSDLARYQSQVFTYRAYVEYATANIDCEAFISKSRRYVSTNGVIKNENTNLFSDHFITQMPIYLFWASYGAQSKGSMRLKHSYIKRNGVFLMNAIPVIKDNTPCLYDKSRGIFLYNKVEGHQFGYKKKDGTIINPT